VLKHIRERIKKYIQTLALVRLHAGLGGVTVAESV